MSDTATYVFKPYALKPCGYTQLCLDAVLAPWFERSSKLEVLRELDNAGL